MSSQNVFVSRDSITFLPSDYKFFSPLLVFFLSFVNPSVLIIISCSSIWLLLFLLLFFVLLLEDYALSHLIKIIHNKYLFVTVSVNFCCCVAVHISEEFPCVNMSATIMMVLDGCLSTKDHLLVANTLMQLKRDVCQVRC